MLNGNKTVKKLIALTSALVIFTSAMMPVHAAEEEVYEDLIIKEILAEQQAENEAETSAPPSSDAVTAEESEGGRVIFLLYHHIAKGDTLGETDDPLWCTTEEKLKSDIAAFRELGFESLNCRRYYAGDYDKSKDYFVITFDDGYLSNYEILPTLTAETGTYADIFMCTEMTLLDNHFNYGQAKEMDNSEYIDIYSHFNKHEYVDELSRDELLRKLKLSYYYLDRRLNGERDMFFAYPHSSYSEDTVRELRDFGVKLQFVQTLPNSFDGYDWNESGMTLRINVAFESDIEQIVTEYFEMAKALPKVEVVEADATEEVDEVTTDTDATVTDEANEAPQA